ncbi:50S ribosomal protein L35 [Orenia marismortui]|uniref:Large ribosomal subunit protein bL35 n=1 Tax=Orenia marismortui TaxID=46469 RepID=A0A4V3GXQ8_9FIRM|nr:50S ribosomal protein L35 [Orenia marismortui]TDX49074.1 LSU ribosomal protein L35P [Orenia marismortui]
MGKMKTHKGTKKRFKKTAKGKFKKKGKAFASHLMTNKSGNRKRKLRGGEMASKADSKRISEALPYE